MGQITFKPIVLGLFVLACLIALAAVLSTGVISRDTFQQTVESAGAWGMLVYVVGVVVLELIWIPRAWGLFVGGLLFGPIIGGLLSVVGDMIGATLCYLIARGGGRDWVMGMIGKRPKAQRVIELLAGRRGGFTVAALRVMPVAHYTLVSYAAGLTGVRLTHFLIGNAVGLLPGAIIYPLVGDSALEPTSPTFIICVSILVVGFLASAWYAKVFLTKNK
jgi:uncharacterized membrane protein YdjX (TVP38/TMEM64 family)